MDSFRLATTLTPNLEKLRQDATSWMIYRSATARGTSTTKLCSLEMYRGVVAVIVVESPSPRDRYRHQARTAGDGPVCFLGFKVSQVLPFWDNSDFVPF